MGRILFSIVLASILWSACSKSEIPDSGSGDPVFWLNLNVEGGDSAFFTAGKDQIYLDTAFNRDTSEVQVMSGTFANVNCPSSTCPGSARFDFRSESVEPNISEPYYLFGPDFDWKYKSPSTSPPFFGTVAIRWVTPSGNIFKSDVFSNDSSTFKILKSEPWEANERGETTWKMDVSFSCWALDSMLNQERLLTGNGVIGVSYR